MLAKVFSGAVFGVDAYEVEIEVNAGHGEPKVVGGWGCRMQPSRKAPIASGPPWSNSGFFAADGPDHRQPGPGRYQEGRPQL